MRFQCIFLSDKFETFNLFNNFIYNEIGKPVGVNSYLKNKFVISENVSNVKKKKIFYQERDLNPRSPT